jgi:hypothetical protein
MMEAFAVRIAKATRYGGSFIRVEGYRNLALMEPYFP